MGGRRFCEKKNKSIWTSAINATDISMTILVLRRRVGLLKLFEVVVGDVLLLALLQSLQ
jgi:hypothetical protein